MAFIFKKNDPKVINAWTFYDWANSVYNLIISTAIFPIFYIANTSGDKKLINGIEVDMVSFFGFEFVNTELYSYVYSASFFVVVLLVPILSGIADYSGTKKMFLKIFCYMGALACMSLYKFDVDRLELSMLSVFVASIGFWGSIVFYNSFLLEIADKDKHDAISAKGFSLGYLGSVLLLITILILSQFTNVMPIKAGFILVGVWWIGFAQYTYYYLPSKSHYETKVKRKNVILNGYRELLKVWKQLRQHPKVRMFLASYFTYNTGVQTVMLLAVLFASKEIAWVPADQNPVWWQTRETGLIVSIILIQLIAIVGAYAMSNLSFKMGNIRTLMLAAVIWVVCTVIAYFITTPIQFYVLAALVGFVMGGTQSLSRSTYSKMLPETDDSASFFSFFDVMEKMGLIIGPLLFGFLEGYFGSMRVSVLMLMFFFIVGFFLLAITRRVEYKDEQAALV
ncbi:MAG: UMF1 family MFS transporter [Bacteroidia bacterium]